MNPVEMESQTTTFTPFDVHERGTYLLIFRLVRPARLEIGRLGLVDLASGYFAYVGSALGPGGLAARVNHHLKRTQRPRWHVDYLRRVASLEQVWYAIHDRHRECEWAEQLGRSGEFSARVHGFGASDCQCPSHLFYGERAPRFDFIASILQGSRPGETLHRRILGESHG